MRDESDMTNHAVVSISLRSGTESIDNLIKKALKADTQKIITINAEKDNYTQARFASLDKNIIHPLLEHWKFIEVEKIGRNHWIKMTEVGKNAAEFLIS